MNAAPVIAAALELVSVMVSALVSLIPIVPGLKLLLTVGAHMTLSLSLAELVCPLMVAEAVLVSMPQGLPVREPVTVKVRLLLLGMLGRAIPAPCMAETVGLAGQVAPAAAVQLTLLTLRLAMAGSVKTTPLSVLAVALVMTIV